MGTFGKIRLSQVRSGLSPLILYTIEQPWQANITFVSCIPEGEYACKRYSSPKYPDTWEIVGVPSRTVILFHVGNTKDDFQGCIGVGLGLGVVNSKWAVTASGMAFSQFKEYLKGDQEFQLTITQYKP
jgi:hypothetical protein